MWPTVKREPDPTLTQGQQQPLGSSCSLGSMEPRLLRLLGYMPIHCGLAPFPSGFQKNFDPFSGNWSIMSLKKQFNVTFQLFFSSLWNRLIFKTKHVSKKINSPVLLCSSFPGLPGFHNLFKHYWERVRAQGRWVRLLPFAVFLTMLPSVGETEWSLRGPQTRSLQAPELILFSPKKFTIDDHYTSILWQIRSSVLNNLRKKHFSK